MAEPLYMTKAGHEKLRGELKRLMSIDRHRVAEEIRQAREHGDISENSEYTAAKEKQAFIEGRISHIEEKLARARVVDAGKQKPDRVRFGMTVRLADLDSGEERRYRIVGEEEADPAEGLISNTSPVARALIGKERGEEVTVRVPSGMRSFEILSIEIE